MPGAWFYDLVYRFGAPWELGVRDDLRTLVEDGRLTAGPGDTAVDLGCGTEARRDGAPARGGVADRAPGRVRRGQAGGRTPDDPSTRSMNALAGKAVIGLRTNHPFVAL